MVVCSYTVTHRHTLSSVGLQRRLYQRRKTGIQAENWILRTAAGCAAFGRPSVPTNIKEDLHVCSLAGFHIEHIQAEHEGAVQAPRASETQRAPKKTRGPSQTSLN